MKTALLRSVLVLGVSAATASLAFAQQPVSQQPVSLTINNGHVTLKTTNATVRQILDEWARVGGTKVVNVEKITSQPMSLTLIDVPEGEALETVLRSAAGYMVAEKQNPTSSGSRYERIMLMARSTPVHGSGAGNTANAYTPPNGQPMPPGGVAEGAVADDDGDPPAPMAPVVNPYAQGVNANVNPTPGGNNGVPGMGTGLGQQMGTPGMAQPNQYQQGVNPVVTPGYSNVYGSPNANVNTAATANAAASGAGQVTPVNPPETKFDYANPQKYFQQQQNGGNPSQNMQPYPGVPLTGTAAAPTSTTPSSTPPAGTPGSVNPTVPPNTPANFNPYSPNFNPYNLPAGQGVPGTVSATPQQSVEPDRAKYANPYVQPVQPPQN